MTELRGANIHGALRRHRNIRKFGARRLSFPTVTVAIIGETQIGLASAEV